MAIECMESRSTSLIITLGDSSRHVLASQNVCSESLLAMHSQLDSSSTKCMTYCQGLMESSVVLLAGVRTLPQNYIDAPLVVLIDTDMALFDN